MRIAVGAFLTDETIRPVRLARELEERGFGGLHLPEHTHIPVSRDTPAPMGEPLPREYGRTLDPFVALAAAAAVTTRIGLGTGVALVAQRDPIVLAKEIATLDLLSEGRFTLGVGLGWNEEEARDHGVDWPRRRTAVRDKLAVMRALWAAEPTPYEGEFASVSASDAHPKPHHPVPVLLGGAAGPRLFADIAAYADGWLPIGGRGLDESVARLRHAWNAAGRTGEPRVVPYGLRPTHDRLARLRDLGVTEAVVQLPPAGTEDVLRTLDEYAQFL
ncbi:TIGR03619 family F420-dependent LLM class oxidoreductase [Streptantibioticus parmotrematis]|uniref:TIGR03619 family F420-dependent LLM class oxidoreductase n=1 Tax=Streptantibioticus parmotrematis TaxID=2873249 RepID=UPI0033E919DE